MSFQQYPFKGGVPTGTTAQRPGSPSIGDVFYNGDLGLLEIYTSVGWQPSSAPSGTPSIVLTDLASARTYAQGPGFTADYTPSTLGGFATGFIATATSTVTASVYSGTSTTTSITVSTFAGATGYGATYTVAGASYNGFGASPNATGSITVTTKPETPTIGTATASTSNNALTVTWTNGGNGGKPLTSITITPYLNGTTAATSRTAATTSSTSYTFTEGQLTAGSSYTFKIKSTSANGDSPESSASNSATMPSFVEANFLVLAGGAGGGNDYYSAGRAGGGGGAGGLRSSVTATGGGGTLQSSLFLLKNPLLTSLKPKV